MQVVPFDVRRPGIVSGRVLQTLPTSLLLICPVAGPPRAQWRFPQRHQLSVPL
jgi:hypothetical protein